MIFRIDLLFEALILELFIEVIREVNYPSSDTDWANNWDCRWSCYWRCDRQCRSRIEFHGHCRSDDRNFEFCRTILGNEYDNTTHSISIYACSCIFWFFWHRDWDTCPFYPSDESVIIETALFVADCSI